MTKYKNIDICIMAHPSRAENVEKILASLDLPPKTVYWDDRIKGGDAMYTAKKAWSAPVPIGCTHRLVIQDDILVCNNFCEIANKIAEKYPDEVITFFHCDNFPQDIRYQIDTNIYGCGIMIPVKYLNDLWDFIYMELDDTIPEHHNIKLRDTSCIRVWARTRDIPCYTTVPSLLQHIGDTSLVGIKKQRVAPDYCENPNIEEW